MKITAAIFRPLLCQTFCTCALIYQNITEEYYVFYRRILGLREESAPTSVRDVDVTYYKVSAFFGYA